jgi:hypothetical protein
VTNREFLLEEVLRAIRREALRGEVPLAAYVEMVTAPFDFVDEEVEFDAA